MTKHVLYTLGLAAALYLTAPLPAAYAQGNGKDNNKEAAGNEEAREKPEHKKLHERVKHKSFVAQKKQEALEAREKGKAKSDQTKADKPEKTGKADKNNKGKGNAYGKNKGELSGREFGQARAAAAKLTNAEKREVLKKTVTEGSDKVTDAKGRLGRAIEELERKRKAGTITDTEYNEKQATISRAEKAIQVLEEKVNAARVLVSAPVVE